MSPEIARNADIGLFTKSSVLLGTKIRRIVRKTDIGRFTRPSAIKDKKGIHQWN